MPDKENLYRSPWLDIPLADYEGHMALPHIGQAQLLSEVFSDALRSYGPSSVAVLGCAGGNGFERISTDVTRRVVGVDINSTYVREASARFSGRIPGLELLVADVQTEELRLTTVDLIFAALLFEYV